jgi:cell division protease FtsH
MGEGQLKRDESVSRRDGEQESRRMPWRTEGLERRSRRRPSRRRLFFVRGLLVVLLVLNVLAVNVIFKSEPKPMLAIPYNLFDRELDERNIVEVRTRGDTIQGRFREPITVPVNGVAHTDVHFTTRRPSFANDNLIQRLLAQDVTVNAEPVVVPRSFLQSLVLSILPWLLIIGLYVLILRTLGARFGFGLGKSRAKLYDPKTAARVTFADVAGIDEVQTELREIVDMLRHPERYRRLGASLPRGVLLEGMPGTGKTLLARAVAGEADVPFFAASASEFIEMVVGVGASRVRGLFDEARKVAPAIVFIDEIDAVGRARGRSAQGGVDEREQTLNQILTEMDGFSGFEGVVVLAATNRIDVLDPALLRPGRFDRRITVSPPDRRGREEILKVHTRAVPLDLGVDLAQFAASTPGMVGADLENLVNEAALLAARRRHDDVTVADMRDALEKVVLGTARHLVMPQGERERTAYHEAGHAVLGMVVPGADPVRKVSIIPRGMALGVTFQSPDEDRYGYTYGQLRARIIGALGGRAAEELVLDDISTGAESDLERVAGLARMMVGRWGMSRAIGPLAVLPRDDFALFGVDGRQPSEDLRRQVDVEVKRIVEECYGEALDLLRRHRDELDGLAQALLERETLDEEEIYLAARIERPAWHLAPTETADA